MHKTVSEIPRLGSVLCELLAEGIKRILPGRTELKSQSTSKWWKEKELSNTVHGDDDLYVPQQSTEAWKPGFYSDSATASRRSLYN